MLELKDGRLSINGQVVFRNLSFVAEPREVLLLTGKGRHSVVEALMGFRMMDGGWVSVDYEPMLPLSATLLRGQIVYVPADLPVWNGTEHGPRVSSLLRAPFKVATCNEQFSKQALMAEWALLGIDAELFDRRAAEIDSTTLRRIMLSLAGVLQRSVVVVDFPDDGGGYSLEGDYLRRLAEKGRAVVVSADDDVLIRKSNKVIVVRNS